MKRSRLMLVVMIDALGHRIVTENKFLDGLVHPSRPVETIFGYSSSAIPSLLTGALPRDHGHFAMYLRNTKDSPFRRYRWMIRLFGEWLGREWFLQRKIVPRLKQRGVTGYFSLYQIPPRLLTEWDLCQKKNLFHPDAIPGYPTVFDEMSRRGIGHRVWDWSVPLESGRDELRASVKEGRDPVLFYYTSHLDGIMHAHGTRSEETRAHLRDLDALIRSLVEEGKKSYDDVRLFVFGDHGMADVTASHDLMSRLPETGPAGRRGVLYFIDSTMARFWFDSPGERDRVAKLLEGEDYGRCLTKEEERQLGVDFADHRYGELLFLVDEGHCLVPSFMGRDPVAAMHGYHPEAPDSYTTLLTNTDVEPPQCVTGLADLLKEEALRAAGEGGSGA